jgi:prevent-host-death family protein
MKIAPVADVKAHFSSYLKESERGPIIVTRNGKPVAVLIAMEDEEELERIILAYSPKFQSILKKGRKEIREGRGVSHGNFWKDVEAEKNPLQNFYGALPPTQPYEAMERVRKEFRRKRGKGLISVSEGK